MENYEKQARDFCEKHNVTMESKWLYHGPYFDGEKGTRDVYEITIKREGKPSWVFKFGQSMAKLRSKKPTEYDILACITKHDPEDFESFCANFGYNSDSRKAEKLYFAVQQEFKACRRMFGDCMDELQEIA